MTVREKRFRAENIGCVIEKVIEKYYPNAKKLRLKLNIEGENTDKWIMCDPGINGENKEKIIAEIEALLMRPVSIGTRHIYVERKLV